MLALPPRLLTPNDAAALLNCSVRHLYKKVSDGSLPVLRLGGRLRFQPEDVQALLTQSPATTPKVQL